MTTPSREFRSRLVEVIGERTQEAFAAEVGVDQTTVSRWLTGAAVPGRRMAYRLTTRYPELREPLMDALFREAVA